MKAWDAVIFDLDDTLYPEVEYVLGGMRAVARWAQDELGTREEATYSELAALVRLGVDGRTFNHWLRAHEAPDAWAPTMVRVYRQHEPRIAPYPGICSLLTQLRSGCRLGIVTDGYLDVQERKVAALGLEPFFDEIVYSDRWGRESWKPSPRPFQHVLRRLAVAADAALYVGDNPAKDFRGARSLGMKTLRVRHRDALHRHVEPVDEKHAPDWDVNAIEELRAFLKPSAAA